MLSNLGINVTSLVASLGIGGIAIALAVQNILGDLFSAFSIYFDKPFAVGDFITVGKHKGTVQNIGLKSTRIRMLQGEELVIPNKEITSGKVSNYRRMEKRRVAFKFGVVYETKTEQLKKIPEIITEIINQTKDCEAFRVHFKEFGDSSLNYNIVYYVTNNDYDVYLSAQQEINLGIKEAFEKAKIEFAYPTQTVYINK